MALTDGKTVITLEDKDAALVVKEDGRQELYIPKPVDMSEIVPPSIWFIAMISFVFAAEDEANQLRAKLIWSLLEEASEEAEADGKS